jgi:alanine dehydrogenase
MLVVSENEVKDLLDLDELIAALEQAHIQFSAGRVVMPVRLVVPLPEIQGRISAMPAFMSEGQALGIKIISYFRDNPKQGLPPILATISLYSAETGKLLVLMDGVYITAIRTACASAVATKALARPETPVLGILGAGTQARTHIRAVSRVRSVERVLIWSPSKVNAIYVREELEDELGLPIQPQESAEAVVRGADILTAVTDSAEPVLEAGWLKPGVHINAVGSHRPDAREMGSDTVKRATVVVDSLDAVNTECGDILLALKEGAITPDHLRGEIGEVLAGAKPGRTGDDEITMYKSVGIAAQDVAAASLVYRRALDKGVGTEVEM